MSDGGTILFLHGADMAPETIRATWTSARFIARARVSVVDLPGSIPPGADAPDIWGILVSVPSIDDAGAARPIAATTDDGRTFTARPATSVTALADPAAIIAAARYWELPPAYVTALAAAEPAQ